MTDERPLGGYLALMAGYGAATAGMVALIARTRGLPERLTAGDGALLALATHKLSRTLAKDAVTSPLRAPFTKYYESAPSGEINEEVHGSGLQKAAGELVTCPFCLDQWVATALVGGLAFAPRLTRLIASTFAVRAAADLLHFAYAKAEQATEA